MSTYRYEYANKTHGRDYKGTCPRCGHKNRFRRFFDRKENQLCGLEFGKCDRINSCGYELRPEGEVLTAAEYTPPPPKPPNFLPRDWPELSLFKNGLNKGPLVGFLRKHWPEEAPLTMLKYYLSSVDFGGELAPLFFYISQEGNVHGAKIMRYQMEGGEPKRVKDEPAWKNFKWLHSKIDGYEFRAMAYGAHILGRAWGRDKDVHVVESEKTALIMSCVRPQYIWLATGSLNNLQKEYLPDLSDRHVVLHPDKGEKPEAYWRLKAKEFLDESTVGSIEVSTFVSKQPSLKEGDDIADYIIQKLL